MRVVDINRIGAATPPHGVDEAWVVDPAARSPEGTATADVRPEGRPQLVVRPGPLSALEADVARNRVVGGPRAVRLCPGPAEHDYPLEPWVLSPLPEFCASEDIAVLVDPGLASVGYPWAAIVRLARDHPGLVVVALAAPLGASVAQRALDAAPNLVLETSGLTDEAGDELRRLIETAGGFRFAFGSGDRTIEPSTIASFLPKASAADVLAGTADLIDRGAWGPTYL